MNVNLSEHSDLVLVAYDQTDTQGVADSVVKYLRRDHGYQVVVCGPGHGVELHQIDDGVRTRARFFLELDAVSGVLYHAQGLELLSCPKLAWFVDSHKKPHFHHEIAREFDVVFFAMWAWGGLFGERGRWLPVHFDADWFGAHDRHAARFDVGFVGSRPRERTRVLQEIADRHGLSLLLETTTGPREKELTADLYAQCKVVFNQHVANDMNFRVVEALACRRLLLTDGQRNGQYELFRDREHLVYYKDDDDLEALLLHFLRAEGERERIAAAGHELVHRLHTTAARVRTIVATAENLLRARGGPPRRTIATEIVHAVSSPPALRALVLAGELDREPDQLDRLSTVLRALAGPGVQADVLALAPPEEHVRDARLHLAAGPRLPALDTAPRAGALLQNVPLLAGARRLLEQGDCTPDVVVATRQEHARTARALGRPFSVVVDSVPTSAEDVQILERASALLTLSPELQVTLSGRLPALAARLLCLCDPEHGAKVASLLRAHVHTRCSGGDSAEGRPAPPLSTLRAADVLYDHEYMRRNRYSVRSPEEARLKAVQAGLIRRVLSPRRALVAGCAAGELLLPLLAGGVDAWGFDAARDLEAFVYPEVRGRVVAFDVARIHQFPFATTGGSFDTFVAIDLFEHIDEERVDSMLDGIAAHFERLALVISSSPAFEGHVCVKPFPWWLAKLEARGFELLAEPSVLEPHETGTYGVRRFAGVHEDMSEQLVFLRRRSRRDGAAAAAEAAAARAQPDVSVMLVCCDRPQPLEVTIESTRCSLVGSKTSTEWLAFDNGSSAPVRRLLDEGGFDTVLRSRENRGLAPALDALFREARGRYLLTLEDDWRCLAEGPEWLELAVAVLESQPDVGVVRLRRRDDGQCGHFRHHRPEVALRHHPWSVVPLPDVVETRIVNGQQVYVAAAEWVNWTHNPTLCRREVREWLGSLSALLLDPRDHRPRAGHPGLEGAIDVRWRAGPWKVAKLLDGPFTHIGDLSAGVGAS